MRKRVIGEGDDAGGEQWLDLEAIAEVEITSEEPDHPIEAALTGNGSGWRASRPGEQTIRLLFDDPMRLRHIRVEFDDGAARTQEFVLRWSPDRGRSHREIVRQQFTFSPSGATRQAEDYAVDLSDVTLIELTIVPDIQGGSVPASLKRLRVA